MSGRIAICAIVVVASAVLAGCAKVSVPIPTDPRSPEATRSRTVVAVAKQYVGAPYRWGGSSPEGFDCSGLVRYVYAQVGVSLPHNAAKQYRLGTVVAREDLEPGDLVFFDRLRHNGIYVGGGRFIHARQTGRRVGIASLDDEWYASHFVGGIRLDPPAFAAEGDDRRSITPEAASTGGCCHRDR
jgi:uncharacterized protein YfaT (DUF1175 family)